MPPRITAVEERKLIRRFQAGKREAGDALLIAHQGFLAREVWRHGRRPGFNFDDLMQVARLALIHAVEKFELKRKTRLLSYAVNWVRAYIAEWFRKAPGVKIPLNQFDRSVQSHWMRLIRETGSVESITAEFLAARFQVPLKKAQRALDRIRAQLVHSADAPLVLGADVSFLDARMSEEPNVEEFVQAREQIIELKQFVWRFLDEREQRVIRERFLTERPMTLRRLGVKLGVSRERVRQIQEVALEKLRNAYRSDGVHVPVRRRRRAA